MFAEYIKAAMDKAVYEIIDDPEPFYGRIPGSSGRLGHRNDAGSLQG